jgi:hypothetical protein
MNDARKPVERMHTERFKAGREEPEASPEGNYRPHSVTMLKMKPEEYDFFVARMKKYESCMEAVLQRIAASVILPAVREMKPDKKK